MPIDVQAARTDTPGCEVVVHLNNAGASLMPQPVVEAFVEHVRREARIGGYEAADEAQAAIARTYDAIARLINAHPDEIAVVENATRAWDMAFHAIPFGAGDRILTSTVSYASNFISFLQAARRYGLEVQVIEQDEHGQIDTKALYRAIDGRVRLIALTHVPTNGGLVNPAAAVGQIAKDAGVLFLLDACQSAGQMPLDVEALGVDLLSATSRKYLRGPRGMGFLYARRSLIDTLEPPLLDLHAATWTGPTSYEIRPDARRFENWESNVAAKIAFGHAVDYALDWGLAAIWERIQELAGQLRDRLQEHPGITVHDQGRVRCGIVTFSTPLLPAESIRQHMRMQRINVSVSTPRSTLLDAEARQLPDLVRASVHYFNTEEEINHFSTVLFGLLNP